MTRERGGLVAYGEALRRVRKEGGRGAREEGRKVKKGDTKG